MPLYLIKIEEFVSLRARKEELWAQTKHVLIGMSSSIDQGYIHNFNSLDIPQRLKEDTRGVADPIAEEQEQRVNQSGPTEGVDPIFE